MKLTKTGSGHNAGTHPLASEDLSKRAKAPRRRPTWTRNPAEVSFEATGRDGKSTYDYEFTFTASDVICLLDLAVPALATDAASRAVCIGALASLRELLVRKEVSKQSKP